MVNYDITESSAVKGFPQFDLSSAENAAAWEPTKAAYDISINNLPFFLRINNQDPYVRETAEYKKDQFDSSNEPGEQSLTGWWLRSQTSWHDGAGITYFEPGIEKDVSYRFKDSRGVDIWNIGEVSMLPKVYYGYAPGTSSFNATAANDGTDDCIVLGNNSGSLHKLKIVADDTAMSDSPYTMTGHSSGTTYPILSVTTDGTNYYAACSTCIHKGAIGSGSDSVLYRHSASAVSKAFVKFVKGNLIFSADNKVWSLLPSFSGSNGNHTGATDVKSGNTVGGAGASAVDVVLTHPTSDWIWNDASGSASSIYVSGYANGRSEIWSIGFDETLNQADFAGAKMAIQLPFGETVNAIEYILGNLVVATNKGVRVCSVDAYGNLILGPTNFESDYGCNSIASKGNFAYVATAASKSAGGNNSILVRIDLSNQLADGTFAWAYDLEYEASDGDDSYCSEVYSINNQMVMVVDEEGTGEVHIEHTTSKVATGYLETGLIRYATVEPKFFKYLKINGSSGAEDIIGVYVTDSSGTYSSVDNIHSMDYGKDLSIANLTSSQETIGIKFVFYNNTPLSSNPVLSSYQLKALPAAKRQRMIQYPLSCFDVEMDKFNASTGYVNRAYEKLSALESLEELGDIVTIRDYRTDETFDGLIENIRFSNESSPDKNNNGYGGIVIVTVRKI